MRKKGRASSKKASEGDAFVEFEGKTVSNEVMKVKSKRVLSSEVTAEKLENECVLELKSEEKVVKNASSKKKKVTSEEEITVLAMDKKRNLEMMDDEDADLNRTIKKALKIIKECKDLEKKNAWEAEKREALDDKNADGKSTEKKVSRTKEKEFDDSQNANEDSEKKIAQEAENKQWMQRSTARSLRKLKCTEMSSSSFNFVEVDEKKKSRAKHVYKQKEDRENEKLKKSKKVIQLKNEGSVVTKVVSKIELNEPRSTFKQKIREQIKDILLNTGWTIDLRPRNGRDYKDAVYIPPTGGGGYWSITKAYNVYVKQCEKNGTMSTSAMVAPDLLNMLTRVVVNKRGSGKSKTEKSKKRLVRKDGNEASKARKKRGTGFLIRGAKKGDDGDDDYEPYEWKRSVLSWMIDMGVISLDGKVKYMNTNKTQVLLKGSVTREGILCGCCSKTVSVSSFEIHAGSKLNQPYQNIVLEETGVSLLDCQVNAWEKQKDVEKQDFYSVNIDGDDFSDDTCAICGDGGDLVCCDGCPSTFHLNCLGMEMLPPDDWHCTNCSCKYCDLVSDIDLEEDDSASSTLLTCLQCQKKYHHECIPEEDAIAISSNDSDASFCGKSCRKVFKQLQKFIGTNNDLEAGLSWRIIRRFGEDPFGQLLSVPKKIECNSKTAVAFTVMDECFRPFVDHRSGINLIHNVVYNCGSNISRISYTGFYTFVLERCDEIIAVASVRIHGTKFAEMPFIGTRDMYRRQGMCRQLLGGIESALYSFNVEKLIIPAISELTETWTGTFGFKHLGDAHRQDVKSANILVFPGTGLLYKPILNKSSANENTTDGDLGGSDLCIQPKVDQNELTGEYAYNVNTSDDPQTKSEHEVVCHNETMVENNADATRSTSSSVVEHELNMNDNREGQNKPNVFQPELKPVEKLRNHDSDSIDGNTGNLCSVPDRNISFNSEIVVENSHDASVNAGCSKENSSSSSEKNNSAHMVLNESGKQVNSPKVLPQNWSACV